MPRLMTYNVHRCVGTDRRLDVDRIADVIAEHEPDVVCLQELDVGRARTGGIDQAHAIADRLAMSFRFHPAMRIEEELYGDAILTPHPERLVRAAALPYIRAPKNEPRGALWVAVEFGGVPVQIINTHLGLIPMEQRMQAASLVGPGWLGHPDCIGPRMLVGDFNAMARSRPYERICQRLADAQVQLGLSRTVKTFPSNFPAVRIDHCFVSPEIRVIAIAAPNHPLARTASDHLPLVIDFELTEPA